MAGSADVSASLAPVSVVICAYTDRRWALLGRAVDSVAAQSVKPLEVILVIDHNPTLAIRARSELRATVIENQGLEGLSDARNTGVAAASGEIVAFLDDDARADSDWIERIVEAMASPGVHAVGGSARPEWEAGRPAWFPHSFDWVVGCSYEGMPTSSAAVRNVIGCNMAFRRSVLDRVGGFDPAMGRVGTRPLGCEETELCIRIGQEFGEGSIRYEPQAGVAHTVSAERGTWRYFFSRCYFEGISKATVVRLRGSDTGLSSERSHAASVLPRAAGRALRDFLTLRDRSGVGRAVAIVLGLALATAGYVRGSLIRPTSHGRSGRTSALGVH